MKYRIVEDPDKIDVEDVARLLKMTYWANHRSKEQIEKSMRNASCYGMYLEGEEKLVGFARVISDYATTYYLTDVVIDADHRQEGLGTALVAHIESQPIYSGLRGLLITRDAHGLYSKFGYEPADGRAMTKAPHD